MKKKKSCSWGVSKWTGFFILVFNKYTYNTAETKDFFHEISTNALCKNKITHAIASGLL